MKTLILSACLLLHFVAQAQDGPFDHLFLGRYAERLDTIVIVPAAEGWSVSDFSENATLVVSSSADAQERMVITRRGRVIECTASTKAGATGSTFAFQKCTLTFPGGTWIGCIGDEGAFVVIDRFR